MVCQTLCECPGCHDEVDLIDLPEFWVDRELDFCERAKNVNVECPLCHHEFKVDCEY